MGKTYIVDGYALTQLRERALLSQQQLGVKSGFSRGQINRIENGKIKSPQHRTILKLARALSVDPRLLILPLPSTHLVIQPDTASSQFIGKRQGERQGERQPNRQVRHPQEGE